MTEKYNLTAERLAEKLLFHKEAFDFELVDLKKCFPMDQLKPQDKLHELIKEVQSEFDYHMSEFQCSWSVAIVKTGGYKNYKEKNGIDLRARR